MDRRRFFKVMGGSVLALSLPAVVAARLSQQKETILRISSIHQGSRLYVQDQYTNEIYNNIVHDQRVDIPIVYTGNQNIMVRVRTHGENFLYMKPFECNTTLGKEGAHLHVQQEPDPIFL